jgi:hypothetical protein
MFVALFPRLKPVPMAFGTSYGFSDLHHIFEAVSLIWNGSEARCLDCCGLFACPGVGLAVVVPRGVYKFVPHI